MNKNNQKPSSSHSVMKALEAKKSNIIHDTDKSSIISIVCRICYDGDKDEQIITPCRCKGSVAFVHRSCLETWLAESNSSSCELCHYVYRTERTPKYTAKQSICHWFRSHPNNAGLQLRGLRNDVYACAVLTPLAIIITYVCLFSADYYSQKRFAHVPAAKWTSVSLLVMISIMIAGYYLWVYMVIRYHGRAWYYCWQRECVVRYIPPSSQNLANVTAPEEIQDTSTSVADPYNIFEPPDTISITVTQPIVAQHANDDVEDSLQAIPLADNNEIETQESIVLNDNNIV